MVFKNLRKYRIRVNILKFQVANTSVLPEFVNCGIYNYPTWLIALSFALPISVSYSKFPFIKYTNNYAKLHLLCFYS